MLEQAIAYLLYLILFILFLQNNYRVFIFLFPILFHFNLDFFLPSEAQLLGFIDLAEINAILMIIIVQKNFKKTQYNINLRKYQKAAIFYILICILFETYYAIKIPFVSHLETDYFSIIRSTLRWSMYIYAFIVLIQRMNNKMILNIIDNSLVIFAIIFSASTIISKHLYQSGTEIGISAGLVVRAVGLFEGGDENVLASLLAMLFGYFLANIEKGRNKKSYYIAMALIVIGIINTGSRGGLIGLFFVIIIYIVKNRTRTWHVNIVILSITFLLLFYFGTPIIDRLLLRSADMHGQSSTQYYGLYGRIYKWEAYINDLIKHPLYLIAGDYLPKPTWMRFSPHNVFIKMLYFGGLLFFIPFVKNLISIIKLKNSKNPNNYSLFYVMIPLLIMYMELNTVFYFSVPLFIMMSYGIKRDEIKTEYNKTIVNNELH